MNHIESSIPSGENPEGNQKQEQYTLEERDLKELEGLGYTLVIEDKGSEVEIEISCAKPEISAKGLLPKTEDLLATLKRISYNVHNFGEAYGMPEAETRKILNTLSEKLKG
ncbi:MAG: hypothetical protein EXS52_01945 [Candidatus Staskawiczbacteria bacterium]|nr:hypothetical protein [Candidatus Staskawiczbacteria bacterium]